MKFLGAQNCRGKADTLKLQSKISNSAAEQTGLRHYMTSKVDGHCSQLSGCGCIVVAEFVHTTPLLSYTLCRANYEPCSLIAYFFAVDKTRHTLLQCKSIGNKVGVV